MLHAVEEQLVHHPDIETLNRKRLRPNPLAPWELRIGRVRVFYDVDTAGSLDRSENATESGIVAILAVGVKKGNRLWFGHEEVEL